MQILRVFMATHVSASDIDSIFDGNDVDTLANNLLNSSHLFREIRPAIDAFIASEVEGMFYPGDEDENAALARRVTDELTEHLCGNLKQVALPAVPWMPEGRFLPMRIWETGVDADQLSEEAQAIGGLSMKLFEFEIEVPL